MATIDRRLELKQSIEESMQPRRLLEVAPGQDVGRADR
jgi:hypothetical protein